jgi:hypothetical protein
VELPDTTNGVRELPPPTTTGDRWREYTEAAQSGVSAFWRANRRGLSIALIGTVALRLITEWIGLVSQYGINFPHEVARQPILLIQVWNHWDVGYYESIAQYGYPGHAIGAGQAANSIAFSPMYPWGIHAVHSITTLGWIASAELLSALAVFVSIATLHRLATLDAGVEVAGTSVMLLLAFPTAFFLLAPYPESLALALVALAFLAARKGYWLAAGSLAAAATLTKYYLAILVVALAVEVWQRRRDRQRAGDPAEFLNRDALRLGAVALPTVVAMGAFMLYQRAHMGSALAFIHAQEHQWHRHLAAPWTLFSRTISDLVHWRFLDTSTQSVTELFDFVSVVVLAVITVYVFLRMRRSYGVFLGLAWCVYTFETILLSVTREVLVLFPLFIGLGVWTSRNSWRERVMLVLFIPCSYFLIQRYVTGAFAG